MSDPNNPAAPPIPPKAIEVSAHAAPALWTQAGVLLVCYAAGAATVLLLTGESLDRAIGFLSARPEALLPVGGYLATWAWRWRVKLTEIRQRVLMAWHAPDRVAVVKT
jgi:hypothetical protein